MAARDSAYRPALHGRHLPCHAAAGSGTVPPVMRPLLLSTLLLVAFAVPSHAARPSPELSPGAHKITIAGAEIAFHVAGSGPVILVHPGGPGIEWSFVRLPLVEKFATVVYIEPIGTGASGRLADPRGFTMERYVGDVEGLRAHLRLEKFVLLGHSHGGFVAESYALAYQSHLRGLILYDTSPTTGPEWQKDVESNLQWFKDEPWFAEATDEEITAILRREFPFYFAEWTARDKEFGQYRARVDLCVVPGTATTETS